jgi:hypothetical protein
MAKVVEVPEVLREPEELEEPWVPPIVWMLFWAVNLLKFLAVPEAEAEAEAKLIPEADNLEEQVA